MHDEILAIAVAQAATAYVRPNAAIFTLEEGRHVLHVVPDREAALRLLAAKRGRTQEERYRWAVEVVEDSILPEATVASTVTITSPIVQYLMEAVFDVMPKLEPLDALVFLETPGFGMFFPPSAPEVVSGFGTVRLDEGPIVEVFRSREQALDFLRRHDALMDDEDRAESMSRLGSSPIRNCDETPPQVFGGFAAAAVDARYRVLKTVSRKLRGFPLT